MGARPLGEADGESEPRPNAEGVTTKENIRKAEAALPGLCFPIIQYSSGQMIKGKKCGSEILRSRSTQELVSSAGS